MAHKLITLGFDADDTLWQNEAFFRLTQERFAELLAEYSAADHLAVRLLAAERRNLGHYGYGIKGFTLSMIETAIEVTDDRVPARVIREILETGREMLRHPIELLPHVEQTITAVAGSYKLVLITKGDLLDQERKLAQSGLGDVFDAVEIVSEKTPQVYFDAFTRHGKGAGTAMMIGNSLKSDILPALQAGAHAAYVPHDLTWELEHAEKPEHPHFHHLDDLSALVPLLETLQVNRKADR